MTSTSARARELHELACIGLQAIEAQKARRTWLDAKRAHARLLRDWGADTLEAYDYGTDEKVDAAYSARRLAARESVRQARRLRSLIAKRGLTEPA